MADNYDIIIIGTGAGGGTLLHKLRNSGKKILVLERGGFLPREKENWNSKEVFQNERYHTKEVWKTAEGKDLHPGTGYWVGGNTKVYGAALFRLRERDFEKVEHAGGISPEWPLKYKDLIILKLKNYIACMEKWASTPPNHSAAESTLSRILAMSRVSRNCMTILSIEGISPFICPLPSNSMRPTG